MGKFVGINLPLRLVGCFVGIGSALAPSGPVRASCTPRWSVGQAGLGVNGTVRALAMFDDGTGPALYAGGEFTSAGGVAAAHIARWDGGSWSALGAGVNGTVWALCVFDDGSGPALYAGGDFTQAGGVQAANIARWNGSSWSAVGTGTNGGVFALAVFNGALHAGGIFTSPAGRVARWNGSTWSSLGPGLSGGQPPHVRAMAVYDDGTGPALYVGGDFHAAGAVTTWHIARWSGTAWSAVGAGLGNVVNALAVFDDGSGAALYAGGFFVTSGVTQIDHVGRWNGAAWSPLAEGCDDEVNAFAVFDDGSGPALYVGGWFTRAGTLPARRVARWTGAWSTMDDGIADDPSDPCWCDPSCNTACGPRPGYVNALVGVGSALYAGGAFVGVDAGCVPAANVARWSCPPSWQSVADFDADGDVDLVDFGHFQVCFNGPNRPSAEACCRDADFDGDHDVDLIDFGSFQVCFNGPNRPPACH